MISLVSGITDGKGRHARGWLFFEAEFTKFCTRIARGIAAVIGAAGWRWRRAGSRVGCVLGLSREELMREMQFLLSEGADTRGGCGGGAGARNLVGGRRLLWIEVPGMMEIRAKDPASRGHPELLRQFPCPPN